MTNFDKPRQEAMSNSEVGSQLASQLQEKLNSQKANGKFQYLDEVEWAGGGKYQQGLSFIYDRDQSSSVPDDEIMDEELSSLFIGTGWKVVHTEGSSLSVLVTCEREGEIQASVSLKPKRN